MKKKLVLRKETVSILDGTMKNVLGGDVTTGSMLCIRTQDCVSGDCNTMQIKCKTDDTLASMCALCRITDKCVSGGADICLVTYDGPSCLNCEVEM